MKIIRPTSREQWLEIRKSGIGSSDVATIVGLNPFETRLELWQRIMGITPAKEENNAMLMGHLLEDAVAQRWSQETGKTIIKRSAIDWIVRDDNRPYMQVSPDRTFWVDDSAKKNHDNKGILECKTTQVSIDSEDIPKHWFCQVQYQLGVSNLKHGAIAWLTQGRDFGWLPIEFNQTVFDALSNAVEQFWKENVLGKKQPEPSTASDYKSLYPIHENDKFVEVDESVIQDCIALDRINDTIAKAKEEKQRIESELKCDIGSAEGITYNGKVIATWKAPKQSTKFDADAFIAENPELAKKYMVSHQPSRRFSLKPKNIVL